MKKIRNWRIMLIVVAAFILTVGLGLDAWSSFLKNQNVQWIKNTSLTGNPDGPTLEECISNYYGGNIAWNALPNNQVSIEAYGSEQSLYMVLQINRDTGNADLIEVLFNHTYPTEQEFNTMVNAWVQSAQ